MANLPKMAEIWQKTLNWQPTNLQENQFQQLYQLIIAGNRQINLTRITEPEEFWEKHLWDSLRGIAPKQIFIPGIDKGKRIIDIGTGAGFPGLPIALIFPNSQVTLLDSTGKKINFIETVLSALALNNAKTLLGRAEEIGQQYEHRQNYDVAVIRAVGNVSVCAEYSLPLVRKGGLAIIYRGSWSEAENESLETAVEQLGGVVELIEEFSTPLSNSMRHCLYLRKVTNTPISFPRGVGIPSQKPI
ncbi:16S rRNA (guanine(527)-N(7))-methyltransferase RsmG [Dolichospermum circinale CS-534/05]|nr:16S rRNA (guanine(527)-N(7))-methyltransferase RsmG [Dolichospermum circinale]MDB9455359.1 16S rRNA (guanine(527)-N(7))-methyltransferase RsmG [Dolichospermum circinale CS-541/06]MDB9462746.1 16S rRNA (guanine(527)-N(7))-methyltransferase RsmG [Dolichospermum circinale CS-541/04]MDB9476111.1 16S rRNA (guanine(527)-N(7))-methyltransferase RsmG [Dolichospermum circinale CS-537/11]MDB9480516.1 16S rRNA (guanine(527)-N(7))-methyltransferase RsmG [Dolichospermum circinale CS-537/03]MDB9491633.1 